MRATKPLLLGEALHGGGSGSALLGRCGRRIARLADMTDAEYARSFRRRNLLVRWPGASASGKGDAWPAPLARSAASRMRLSGRVIFLGSRVAGAFGVRRAEVLTWFMHRGVQCAILPHPSGINRWWNDPRNVVSAGRFLRASLIERNAGASLTRRRKRGRFS